MAANSKIEWTGTTWNPITGCSKISPGCANCYAERMAKRLYSQGAEKYKNIFQVTLHDKTLKDPLKWRKPRLVFVNSMSDLFHDDVPFSFIQKVFEIMNQCPQHHFQILTKRSGRLQEIAESLKWTENIWMGVSVESDKYTFRIDDLRAVPSSIRFLSIEPLLGQINDMDLEGIHWVVVGGESGPQCRVMKKEWVKNIQAMCIKNKIPFFFKQWGGTNKKKSGRVLDGQEWQEMPKLLNTAYIVTT